MMLRNLESEDIPPNREVETNTRKEYNLDNIEEAWITLDSILRKQGGI